MVSVLERIWQYVSGDQESTKRPIEIVEGPGMTAGGTLPAAKRMRHLTMDDESTDHGIFPRLNIIAAYFSSMMQPKEPRPKKLQQRRSEGLCGEDVRVVGGVEVMRKPTRAAAGVARTPSSPLLPAARLNVRYADEVEFIKSTPSPKGAKKKFRPSTPFPRNVVPSKQHGTPTSRGRHSDKSLPLYNQVLDANLSDEDLAHTAKNTFRGIGNGIRLGGNDGLVDVDDEMDEVLDNGSFTRVSGAADRDVDFIGQYQSPGMSRFRFHPTVTSTTERNIAQSKENIRSSKMSIVKNVTQSSKFLGGTIRKLSLSPARGVASASDKRFFSMTGNKRFIGNTYARSFFSRCGLPTEYFSTARECYNMNDKQVYQRLLLAEASTQLEISSCTSAIPALCAPITKTQLDATWTKQKKLQIEQKDQQKQEQPKTLSKDVALWSEDEKVKSSSRRTNEIRKASYVKSDASSDIVVLDKDGKTNKKGSSYDDDDDDLIITQETVKKIVKPNSLEEKLKHTGFQCFTPEWVDKIRERHSQRQAAFDRQKQESELTAKICRERRLKAPSVEDLVSRRMQLLDMSHPTVRLELSEEDVLVELTPIMEKIITNALRKMPASEVLTEKFNIQITRRDIATLAGLNWLNDEVINFYMNLLMERSENDNFRSVYVFNTFFYPKLIKTGYSSIKRWTKKVDIFNYELLLVPVHLGMHWCLATIDVKKKLISYYDSMLGENKQCLHELKKYLESEHQDKKKTTLNTISWKCESLKDIPQQMNGSDCGMFACKFAEYLSRRRAITFTQDHMPYFRRRMVYEIVTNTLL